MTSNERTDALAQKVASAILSNAGQPGGDTGSDPKEMEEVLAILRGERDDELYD